MAISLVSHVKASATGASVTTAAIDTTGATLLVVLACGYAHDPGAVSDNKSNTWQALTEHDGTHARLKLFYCYNPTVGTGHTFTLGSSSYPTIFATAWSGTLTTSAVFDSESGAGATDNTHSTPGSLTPGVSGELFITGVTAAWSDSLAFAASPGGFSNIDTQPLGATYTGGAIASVVDADTSAMNPTWTVTNGDGPGSAMACFKPSSAAAELAASITPGATVAGALTTAIRMAASITPGATTAAALTTAIRLAAAITPGATTAAALTTAIRLAAAITPGATTAAALTTAIRLAASITPGSSASGALSTVSYFAASITCECTAVLWVTPSARHAGRKMRIVRKFIKLGGGR